MIERFSMLRRGNHIATLSGSPTVHRLGNAVDVPIETRSATAEVIADSGVHDPIIMVTAGDRQRE
jgi:hypothetical protein